MIVKVVSVDGIVDVCQSGIAVGIVTDGVIECLDEDGLVLRTEVGIVDDIPELVSEQGGIIIDGCVIGPDGVLGEVLRIDVGELEDESVDVSERHLDVPNDHLHTLEGVVTVDNDDLDVRVQCVDLLHVLVEVDAVTEGHICETLDDSLDEIDHSLPTGEVDTCLRKECVDVLGDHSLVLLEDVDVLLIDVWGEVDLLDHTIIDEGHDDVLSQGVSEIVVETV